MRISTLALAAAFGLLPGIAAAADYEPPLTVAQAPEYVPVEISSGWYLRGDIGYNLNEPLKDEAFGVGLVSHSDEENPFSGSVGFGYHFTDYLRADLNVGYFRGNRVDDTYGAGTDVHLSNTGIYGMANAYVDLGTYVGITPYVGAGIGVYRSARRLDGHNPIEFHDHDNQYSMAYTLNAGLAYKVTPNLAVDLGYQYFSAPNAEYQVTHGLADNPVKKGINFHQIRLGLRYDLW